MGEFQKGVSWQAGDAVTEEKLQQMVSNDDWLFEHSVQLRYQAYGEDNPVTENIKIAAGSVLFPPHKTTDKMSQNVLFGNYFSPNCKPIIVCTPVFSPNTDPRIMVAINGIGEDKHLPDNRGFTVVLTHELTKNNAYHFGKSTYLHWIAFGY